MNKKDGGPAYPNAVFDPTSGAFHIVDGMSLRDWFAGMAMSGLLATRENYTDSNNNGWEWHATAAYSMADAMIREREDERTKERKN